MQDELSLKTSAVNTIYDDRFTCTIKSVDRMKLFLKPTQSYSFFRNLPFLEFSLSVYEQDLVAQD